MHVRIYPKLTLAAFLSVWGGSILHAFNAPRWLVIVCMLLAGCAILALAGIAAKYLFRTNLAAWKKCKRLKRKAR
jgi:hypothetical protein